MPPKRKAPAGPKGMAAPLSPGIVVTDLMKKTWKLGPVIGQGGFGYLYLGNQGSSGAVTDSNSDYVIKVEPHANGPLFVELAFYQRVAKPEMVNEWLRSKKRSFVGIPLYIGTGSFEHGKTRYRFMVMDRFGTDVEKIYKAHKFKFPEKTVYSLGLRILDCLEYIHNKEYVHADIKSSNLMLGKTNQNKMYLLDYGLAYRYAPNGAHVPYKEDPKRKHDGTIEYTSRDVHKGCAPSRKGDLEILGYCMVQWLCGKLPWEDKLTDKEYVHKQKTNYMDDINGFMKKCFPSGNKPDEVEQFLRLVVKMKYEEAPNYQGIKKLFEIGVKKHGGKDDGATICLPNAVKPSPQKKRASTAVERTSSPARKKRASSPAKQRKPPASSRVSTTVAVSPSKRVTKTPTKKARVSSPVAPQSAQKRTVTPKKRSMKKVSLSTSKLEASRTSSEKTVMQLSNGINKASARTVRYQARRKNVQKRDFAQSP